jgi:hypothetical protein
MCSLMQLIAYALLWYFYAHQLTSSLRKVGKVSLFESSGSRFMLVRTICRDLLLPFSDLFKLEM